MIPYSWKTTSCHDAGCCRGGGCVPRQTWKTLRVSALQMCRALTFLVPLRCLLLPHHPPKVENIACLPFPPSPQPFHHIRWPDCSVHSLENGAFSRVVTFSRARNACWFCFFFSRSSWKQPAFPPPLLDCLPAREVCDIGLGFRIGIVLLWNFCWLFE